MTPYILYYHKQSLGISGHAGLFLFDSDSIPIPSLSFEVFLRGCLQKCALSRASLAYLRPYRILSGDSNMLVSPFCGGPNDKSPAIWVFVKEP